MNRISHPLILGVLVAFLSGTLAHAEPNPQKVQLKNGQSLMIKDGRAFVRGSDGKPKPAPNGKFETKDGRAIVVKDGHVKDIQPIGGGGSAPKPVKTSNENVMLKDGTRAFISDGRLYLVVNQHGGQDKAPKGTYKTKDGRKIKVGGGGKIKEIKF